MNFSDFVYFYDFVINKVNKVALSEIIFLTRKSIWRKFKPYFNYSPTPFDSLFLVDKDNGLKSKSLWVMGVDGKWLHRDGVVMIYRDVTKKKWWYTHGNLRRAVKLLKFDEKYLFAYLDYPYLPKTNNSIEGVNSQIKGKLSNHRGMKIPQQVAYIFWLLTFRRVKNKEDLRQLWDRLKNKIFRF